MLVNDINRVTDEEIISKYSKEGDVEFLGYYNYDEKCSLCAGILELNINDQKYSFDSSDKADYKYFFYPTACFANGINEHASYTSWETDISELPDELKPFAKRIDEVINANMPINICMGCY